MNVDFTSTQILFIYCQFSGEIEKLEDKKSCPNCPMSKKDINKEIKLYASVIDSLVKAYPNLEQMNKFL